MFHAGGFNIQTLPALLHMLFLDGVYRFTSGKASFYRAHRSTRDELAKLLDALSRRIVRLLERRGLLIADPEYPRLDLEAGFSLHAATVCEAHQRSKLERLCRYITRSPLPTGLISAKTDEPETTSRH